MSTTNTYKIATPTGIVDTSDNPHWPVYFNSFAELYNRWEYNNPRLDYRDLTWTEQRAFNDPQRYQESWPNVISRLLIGGWLRPSALGLVATAEGDAAFERESQRRQAISEQQAEQAAEDHFYGLDRPMTADEEQEDARERFLESLWPVSNPDSHPGDEKFDTEYDNFLDSLNDDGIPF